MYILDYILDRDIYFGCISHPLRRLPCMAVIAFFDELWGLSWKAMGFMDRSGVISHESTHFWLSSIVGTALERPVTCFAKLPVDGLLWWYTARQRVVTPVASELMLSVSISQVVMWCCYRKPINEKQPYWWLVWFKYTQSLLHHVYILESRMSFSSYCFLFRDAWRTAFIHFCFGIVRTNDLWTHPILFKDCTRLSYMTVVWLFTRWCLCGGQGTRMIRVHTWELSKRSMKGVSFA